MARYRRCGDLHVHERLERVPLRPDLHLRRGQDSDHRRPVPFHRPLPGSVELLDGRFPHHHRHRPCPLHDRAAAPNPRLAGRWGEVAVSTVTCQNLPKPFSARTSKAAKCASSAASRASSLTLSASKSSSGAVLTTTVVAPLTTGGGPSKASRIPALISPALAALEAIWTAELNRRRENKEIRRHQMYLLYQAN